jgi:glycine/D-amino acid oxidase-like deaminating enzyme
VNAAARGAGFWLETAGDDLTPRSPLPGDASVDVAIVGAGFTGLWTAYYLAKADPTLRIIVLEKEIAGYGASGRNGGWCSADFPAPIATVAGRHGAGAAVATQRAMVEAVDEVGRVCAAEAIDAHFVKGGCLRVATTPLEVERLRAGADEARSLGPPDEHLVWLDAGETRRRVDVEGGLGGTYTPHCAAVHPGRLVRGLARAVERLGVTIHEKTPATAMRGGRVWTDRGEVRARIVVRALEAYTGSLKGHARLLFPLHISMGVTERLPASFWDRVGWAERETLSEGRYTYIYAQRTADDRIAFGLARGHSHLGWRTPDGRVPGIERGLLRTLRRLFPAAAGARIARRWSGYVGASRDLFPSVGLERGVAWAGGYFGDGVSTANLAGRTLADLILERDSELTKLPWVGHRWRRWEPQPLSWLGFGVWSLAREWADLVEPRTGRPSRLADIEQRLTSLFG